MARTGAAVRPSRNGHAKTWGLGASIDAYAAYDGQDTCDPDAKPGVTGFRTLLNDAYGDHTGYIGRAGCSPPTGTATSTPTPAASASCT